MLAERATQDRDALLGEIRKFQDRIGRENERDAKIASLEDGCAAWPRTARCSPASATR